MEKEQIRGSVKTAYAQYGLKDSSVEKIANIIHGRMSAMGAVENEQQVLDSEVAAFSPFVGIIQSEVDSRIKSNEPAKSPAEPAHAAPASSAGDTFLEVLEQIRKEQERLSNKLVERENAEKQRQLIEQVKRQATQKDPISGQGGWASNEGLLETAIRLTSINPDEDVQSIVQKVRHTYDQTASSIFGSGTSVPGAGGREPEKKNGLEAFISKLKAEGKLPDKN